MNVTKYFWGGYKYRVTHVFRQGYERSLSFVEKQRQ